MLMTILYYVCGGLVNMVYYLFLAGVMRTYLRIYRRETVDFKGLFFAFGQHPEPLAAYSVLQFILQSAASYGFFYALSLFLDTYSAKTAALTVLAVLAGAVLLAFIQAWLSMIIFTYCDHPELSAVRLIRRGLSLMRGNVLEFLLLELSFIGLLLLGILSLGIGLLFVRPYVYAAKARFYLREIKEL